MRKRVFVLLVSVLMIFAMPIAVFAVDEAPADGAEKAEYIYEDMGDGAVRITEYAGFSQVAVIPAELSGKTVRELGDNAFRDSAVCTVSIPETVTLISIQAFQNCEKLSGIFVDSENPAYASIDGVLTNAEKTELIKYPEAKYSEDGVYYVPDSIRLIGSYAFSDTAGLYCVNTADAEKIADYAFTGNDSIQTIELNVPMREIGKDAFDNTAIGTLCYNGTQEQWNEIKLDEGNKLLAELYDRSNYDDPYYYDTGWGIFWSEIAIVLIVFVLPFAGIVTAIIIAAASSSKRKREHEQLMWYITRYGVPQQPYPVQPTPPVQPPYQQYPYAPPTQPPMQYQTPQPMQQPIPPKEESVQKEVEASDSTSDM